MGLLFEWETFHFFFYLQILNGGTPDIPSAGLLPGQAQETPGYPYSDSSSILGKLSSSFTSVSDEFAKH